MIIDKAMVRRLGIFFFYDKEGIADSYIKYLLNEMKKSLEDLYIVINGTVNKESLAMLKNITPQIIVRENTGFDVWAYKAAIEHIGWPKLSQYDEMVMFNHTIFGPFYSFEEMFSKMDARDLDFWGITKHYSNDSTVFWEEHKKNIPTHLQSHFIAVRNTMIRNKDYQDYWNNHAPINNYKEAVLLHEAIFTDYFEQKGFTWDAYIDTDDLQNIAAYPLMTYPHELLKRGCPILKRKSFFLHYMQYLEYKTYGEAVDKVINFINEETEYDMEYIWENILRTAELYDIRNCFHLEYLIEESQENINLRDKVLLFVEISNKESRKVICEILNCLKEEINVCVLSKLNDYYTNEYLQGLNISYMLIGDKDKTCIIEMVLKKLKIFSSELIGFISDEDYLSDPEAFYRGTECMTYSIPYIRGIFQLFSKENRLGLLTTPHMYHGKHIGNIGKEWTENFSEFERVKGRYNINVPISKEKPIIYAESNRAWVRRDSLVWVLNKLYEDKALSGNMNWLAVLILQQSGKYCAYGMPINVGRRELSNYKYLFEEYQKVLNNRFDIDWFGDSLYYLKDCIEKTDKCFSELDSLRIYNDSLQKEIQEKKQNELKLETYINEKEMQIRQAKEYQNVLQTQINEKQLLLDKANEYERDLEKQIEAQESVLTETGEYCRNLEKQIEAQESALTETSEYCRNLEKQIEAQESALTETGEYCRNLEKQIAAKECALTEIVDCSKMLENDMQKEHAEFKKSIYEKEQYIEKLNEELSDIYTSKAWKIVAHLRKFLKF